MKTRYFISDGFNDELGLIYMNPNSEEYYDDEEGATEIYLVNPYATTAGYYANKIGYTEITSEDYNEIKRLKNIGLGHTGELDKYIEKLLKIYK